MKLVSEDSEYLNAECESCKKILKIKKEQVITTTEGFILNPPEGVKCPCGKIHHDVLGNYVGEVTNGCIYCGGTDIEHNVQLAVYGIPHGGVGPLYTRKGLLGKEEEIQPLYVDICKSCGNLKFWIWTTDRQWKKR